MGLLCAGSAVAQDVDVAEMQRIYREQALPGPEHEMLARLAGKWDMKIRMWPAPGAQPRELTGATEARLILGGRFLVTESAGPDASELVSVGLLGFDRRSGEYHALGMDTNGTYWVTAQGKPGPEGRRVVLSGEDYNPTLDHLQVYDFILEWIDEDTYTWSIVFKDEIHTKGKGPFKMIEITYHRRR